MAEKHHEPTHRKLALARREGRVWRAPLLSQLIGFVVFIGALSGSKTMVMEALHNLVESGVSTDWFENLSGLLGVALLLSLFPVFALLLGAALAASVAGAAMGGFVWSARPLAPLVSKLDPIDGTRKLTRAVMRDGWQLCMRISLVGVIGLVALWSPATALDPFAAVGRVFSLCTAGLLLCAAFDGWMRRREYLRDQRMTDDELRREMRDVEGDPYVKAAQRSMYESLSRAEMLQRLRRAAVLVVRRSAVEDGGERRA